MRLERLTRTHSEHGHARPLTRSPRWASASVKAKCRVVSAWKEEGTQMVEIRLNRAYEKPAPNDGLRVLVERLWPRGLSKERAAVDLWMKDIAPSPELRRWFNHDPAKWDEFQRRYRAELRQKKGSSGMSVLFPSDSTTVGYVEDFLRHDSGVRWFLVLSSYQSVL